MTDLDVANEAVEFLLSLRARRLRPDQILFMDETGLWSNAVERRTYNFVNLYATLIFLKKSCSVLKPVLRLLPFPTLHSSSLVEAISFLINMSFIHDISLVEKQS